MKAFLALFLCGISLAAAAPSACNVDYPKECIKTQQWDHKKFHPESAAELDNFCKDILDELDCQIGFTERCPNTFFGAFRNALQGYRHVFGRFCDKDDSLSEKYLEKASCLNKQADDVTKNCSKRVTEQEYCKRTVEELACREEEFNNVCGRDGAEVVAELFKPKYSEKDVFCGI